MVMSLKNISIRKQFESLKFRGGRGKLQLVERVLVYLAGGKNPGSYN